MSKKIDSNYSKQIGENIHEKVGFIKKNLEDHTKLDFKFLEVGIGGGETLKEILKLIRDSKKVYAIDIVPEFVKNGEVCIGENSSQQNICNLNFENNSFDLINVSSLFHEVYSYGYRDFIGVEAIELCIKELIRVLKPGGKILYRDVLAPEKIEIKKINYFQNDFKVFIKNFLPIYLNSSMGNIYKNISYIEEGSEGYTIFSSNLLHREIQKHYFLCMKNIGYINFDKNKYSINKIYNFNELEDNIRKWLIREGEESYIYYSLKDLEKMVLFTANKTNNLIKTRKKILLRKKANILFSEILEKPELEGKQLLTIKKIL